MNEYEAAFAGYFSSIESALAGFLPQGESLQSTVTDAMAYSLLGGGKRLRGVMVLAFYRQCGGQPQDAMAFACAMEMLHAYSLIHDDLPCMDDADLRRGKPSCHVRYGEAMAVLAGDALQALAFETALTRSDALAPRRVLRAAGEMAAAVGAGGMVGGQVIDLQHEDVPVDLPLLDELNALKTGALIRACARIGCILAGAGEDLVAQADAYGEALGLAFQITDDILDVTSTPEVLGKPVAGDAKRGRDTYATLLGVQRAGEAACLLADRARAALAGTPLESAFLEQLADTLVRRDR